MEVVLREMRPDDLDRVTAILARWHMAPVAAGPDIPMPEVRAIPIATTLVALRDGVIVGIGSYVLAGERRGDTLLLAVDPECRGAGIGVRLQTARLARMKAEGVETVVTETDRPESVDWYVRKFGYRIVGTRPKRHPFGFEGAADWTVLELDLRRWSADALSRR
jgi:ribosomal protein S18 acetylase RimI-like enzyme